MTCKINADTSDGLKIVSDTSGAVDIQSNGVTKVSIDSSGNISTVAGVSTNNGNIAPLRPNVRPLIINGDMAVTQRGTSFTSQTGVAYHLDRYEISAFNVGDGVYRVDQSTDVPSGQGFVNSNKVSCTTADTSQDANNQMYFQTQLEGTATSLLNYFVASPDTVTIAFWVRANRTGSYSFGLKLSDNGSVENNTATRLYNALYSISSANTWEKKVLSITLDSSTSETKVTGTGFAVALQFWLGAGTSRDGVTADQWADNGNATATSDNLDLLGSTSNDWYITGLQMEVGSFDSTTIPPFQHEDFKTNIDRCTRYYQIANCPNNTGVGQGFSSDGTGRGATFVPFFPMRATPTITTGAASTFKFQQGVTTSGAGSSFIVKAMQNNGSNYNELYGTGWFFVHLDIVASGMAQDGRFCRGVANGDTFVECDAEL